MFRKSLTEKWSGLLSIFVSNGGFIADSLGSCVFQSDYVLHGWSWVLGCLTARIDLLDS